MTQLTAPVRLPLRMDWSELDYFGHINNLAFYKYLQAGRLYFFDQIGMTQHHLDTKVGPILAAAECQFKRQLHYPGHIEVQTHTAWIKNSSFGLSHAIVDEAGQIAAAAEEVIVYFDFNAQEAVPLPDFFRAKIEGLRLQGDLI